MDTYKKLQDILKGKIIFIGVGNTLKGDDGAGVVLLNMLKDKADDPAIFLDCGTTPENYLERLKGFDCVVIFDALDFGGRPGEIGVFETKELSEASLSTHNLSLKLVSRYLEEDVSSIVIVGIRPENLRFGEGLSKVVSSGLERFAREVLPLIKLTAL